MTRASGSALVVASCDSWPTNIEQTARGLGPGLMIRANVLSLHPSTTSLWDVTHTLPSYDPLLWMKALTKPNVLLAQGSDHLNQANSHFLCCDWRVGGGGSLPEEMSGYLLCTWNNHLVFEVALGFLLILDKL